MKPPFDIAGDLDTPVSAFAKLGAFDPRFLLESVEGGERLARYSFIGFGKCLEVRLDAALAVVHKHRIGSCEGRLVATADGIRYETTNKEDGFTAPLADMETFQVDYQARNLRIRIRKGRQFNFTDPDDNADRLFVFHRDVERARQRLAP